MVPSGFPDLRADRPVCYRRGMRRPFPLSLAATFKVAVLLVALVALLLAGQTLSMEGPKMASPAAPDSPRAAPVADFASEQPASTVRQMANWVLASDNHAGMPCVIVDKRNAKVFLFHPDGKLSGATPALMGSAVGDDSVAGIGEREMSAILPHERTTPAGRFVSSPGVNMSGEDIIWVDYDAAVSMHRVRANNKKERRLERLASATPDDNRISFGCINLPASFYDTVVKPALGVNPGVVYVLPEMRSLESVFGSLVPESRPQ